LNADSGRYADAFISPTSLAAVDRFNNVSGMCTGIATGVMGGYVPLTRPGHGHLQKSKEKKLWMRWGYRIILAKHHGE